MHAAVSLAMLFAANAPRSAEAALLAALRVEAAPGGGARVVLAFGGPPPAYRVSGTGTSDVTIQLAQTQSVRGLPAATPGTGPIESVRFSAAGPLIVVTIHLTSPAPSVVSADTRALYVEVNATAPRAPLINYTPTRSAAPAPSDIVEVVPLKYADVSEVVGILVQGQTIASNDTFNPQPSQMGQPSALTNGVSAYGGFYGGYQQAPYSAAYGASPFSQTGGGNPLLGAAAAQSSLGQKINDQISVDRRLNAIVLSGSPATVAALRAVIDKIDIPLTSVILETQIVELTETAAKLIGIDYTNNGALASAQLQARSFNPPTGTINLQAAIFDVVSQGGGRLIARPRVVAQSGSSASILTGDAIPIVTNITSFGSSTVTQQQVQYVQVGVNLQIQPRISSDGFVTSHIFSEVSSVTGYVQGFPQISQRVATTAATVRDGESFVIGGLIQENELRNLDKIPGLGDLPLIGGLFRNRRDTRTKTSLYIVVTPRIVQRGAPPVAPPALVPQPAAPPLATAPPVSK